MYRPTLRPTGGRPYYPQPRPVDPNPQPSRPTATTAASATPPLVRVRVRSGPGRPATSTPQPSGSGRRVISLDSVSVSGGDGDDGPVGRTAARLTSSENRDVSDARNWARDPAATPGMSSQQRDAAAEAIEKAPRGETLTEAERDLVEQVRAAADASGSPAAAGHRNSLDALLAEDSARLAAENGNGTYPASPLTPQDESNLDEIDQVVNDWVTNGGGPAGSDVRQLQEALDSMEAGRPMTAAQRAEAERLIDTWDGNPGGIDPRGVDVVLGTVNGVGSLYTGLQQDAFLRFQEQNGTGGIGDWRDIVLRFFDGFPVAGPGQIGGGGFAVPIPVWPMGPGFVPVDPGFPVAGAAGPAFADPIYEDPGYSAAAGGAAAPGAAPPAAPGLESSGTTGVEPSAPAGAAHSPQPGPGEAKYDRRYLSVQNSSAGRLAVFVQYETIDSASGEWKWYPNDPTGSEAVAYSLEAGQEVALKRDAWSLNARRVRIWAATESGELFDQYRGEDLWLVEEQPNGERYYIGTQTETFPLAFGDQVAAQ